MSGNGLCIKLIGMVCNGNCVALPHYRPCAGNPSAHRQSQSWITGTRPVMRERGKARPHFFPRAARARSDRIDPGPIGGTISRKSCGFVKHQLALDRRVKPDEEVKEETTVGAGLNQHRNVYSFALVLLPTPVENFATPDHQGLRALNSLYKKLYGSISTDSLKLPRGCTSFSHNPINA